MAGVDHISTENFPQSINAIKTMAMAMRDVVSAMDEAKNTLLQGWVGEGRNQFEMAYRIMRRKLEDGSEFTWDMYEDLIQAEETLLQNDVDVANGIKTYN